MHRSKSPGLAVSPSGRGASPSKSDGESDGKRKSRSRSPKKSRSSSRVEAATPKEKRALIQPRKRKVLRLPKVRDKPLKELWKTLTLRQFVRAVCCPGSEGVDAVEAYRRRVDRKRKVGTVVPPHTHTHTTHTHLRTHA